MEHSEFITQYRDYPLFQKLSDDEMREILAHGHTSRCVKGQILIQQGDAPKGLYFVMEGSLVTFHSANDGAINVIRMIQKGGICMDAVIFMGTKSPIGIQAVENSKLFLIDRPFVPDFAARNATFACNMLRILSKNYTDTLNKLPVKSAVQRTGYYLLQHYLASNSESFVMHFNRYFVASYLGMSFETLSRTLASIKKLGVEIKGNKVRVPCKCLLCSFCDERTEAVCPDHGHECEQRRELKRI